MSEEWRPIPNQLGYEASDLGRIRSRRRPGPSITFGEPRIMAGGLDTQGYPTVKLSQGKRGSATSLRVHRLVLEAFVGPRPLGMETRHLNGDPSDNRLANLRYGTPSQNNHDRTAHGTNPQSMRTHCPQGHEYTPANTRVSRPKGRSPFRMCKTCEAEGQRIRRARRRGVA